MSPFKRGDTPIFCEVIIFMKLDFLNFRKNTERYHRSSNYREKYMTKHKGLGGLTCCAYCGKVLLIKDTEVDHITPVNKVENTTSGKLFIDICTLFSRDKTSGVNSDWNLTYACHDCNSLKRAKSGEWSRRGYIGKFLFPLIHFAMLAYLVISAVIFFVKFPTEPLVIYRAVLVCIGIKVIVRFSSNNFKNRFRS